MNRAKQLINLLEEVNNISNIRTGLKTQPLYSIIEGIWKQPKNFLTNIKKSQKSISGKCFRESLSLLFMGKTLNLIPTQRFNLKKLRYQYLKETNNLQNNSAYLEYFNKLYSLSGEELTTKLDFINIEDIPSFSKGLRLFYARLKLKNSSLYKGQTRLIVSCLELEKESVIYIYPKFFKYKDTLNYKEIVNDPSINRFQEDFKLAKGK